MLTGIGAGASGGDAPSVLDSAFGLGLAHLAAAAGEPEAWALLARRYAEGEGALSSWHAAADSMLGGASGGAARADVTAALAMLFAPTGGAAASAAVALLNDHFSRAASPCPRDEELGSVYHEWASSEAAALFFSSGKQPLLDHPRLTVDAADRGAVGRCDPGSGRPASSCSVW